MLGKPSKLDRPEERGGGGKAIEAWAGLADNSGAEDGEQSASRKERCRHSSHTFSHCRTAVATHGNLKSTSHSTHILSHLSHFLVPPGPATCPQGILNPDDGTRSVGAYLLVCEYWQPGNVVGQWGTQVRPPLQPPNCVDGRLAGSGSAAGGEL